MKKIIFILISIIFLSSCSEFELCDEIVQSESLASKITTIEVAPEEVNGMKKSTYDMAKVSEDVTLSTKENKISKPCPEYLTLLYANNSDKRYSYGDIFFIEKKIGEDWYNIPMSDGYAFRAFAYKLEGNTSIEKKFYLSSFEEHLDSGYYRIVSKVYEKLDSEEFNIVFCEFIIE